MDATITSLGVFGVILNHRDDNNEEQTAMLPFFAANVMGKRVYCHYTMLKSGKMTDFGFMKDTQMRSLSPVTSYEVVDIAPGTNITQAIDHALREAEHESVLLFCWEEDEHNDVYFFNAVNAYSDRAPLWIDDLHLTVGAPFDVITQQQLMDMKEARSK